MHVPRYLFKGGSLIAASMGYTPHTAKPPLLGMWFVPHGPRGYTAYNSQESANVLFDGLGTCQVCKELDEERLRGVVNAVPLFLRAS